MVESDIYLVDSNVLVYAYEEEESQKKKIAEKLLTECFLGNITLAVSNQNMSEFCSAFLVKGKGDIESIYKAVEDIKIHDNFKKIVYNSGTVSKALLLAKNSRVPFWDLLIIATMLENGIKNIYTENIKDFQIAGIKAINPFRK